MLLILLISVSVFAVLRTATHTTIVTADASPVVDLSSNFSSTAHHNSRFAYAVMLSAEGGAEKGGDEPHYFIGTRTLIYQLLHNPMTRGSGNIDFVVLVADSVFQERRDRLTADGAIVMGVPHLKADDRYNWIKPGGYGRWASVLDKMEMIRLTQYERVLLMDSDVVVVRPLEDIFTSLEVAQEKQNKGDMANVMSDEPSQPNTYVMAGTCNRSRKHQYPVQMCDSMNAGFVVTKPNMDIYNHYLGVMAIENRFDGRLPEQNLWNYIHRRSGNMPWTNLGVEWNIIQGNWDDYTHGMHSFHEKYWWTNGDQMLTNLLNRVTGAMSGYWAARNVFWPPLAEQIEELEEIEVGHDIDVADDR